MSERTASRRRAGTAVMLGLSSAVLFADGASISKPSVPETPESVRNTIAGMYTSCDITSVTEVPADHGKYQDENGYRALKLGIDIHVDPKGPEYMEKYKTSSEHSSDVLWPNQFVSSNQYSKDGPGWNQVEQPRAYRSADIATASGPTEIEFYPNKRIPKGVAFVVYIGNTASTGITQGGDEVSSAVPCGGIESEDYYGKVIWGLMDTDTSPQAEPLMLEPTNRLGLR